MGYLSQKKQQTRENIFFFVMAAVITLLTAGAFADPGFHFGFFNLFHLYCLTGLLFLYALWRCKCKPILFFGAALLIIYTTLASSVNLFISDGFDGRQPLTLIFAPEKELTSSLAENDITAAGSLILARHYVASYAVIGRDAPLTVIRVDFRKARKNEYPQIFKHLHEFILKQDNPVVIFGEFGIPAWSDNFKQFLTKAGLSVKNRLLFTRGSKYNIFSMPGFYVLGFREMGVSDISIDENNGVKTVRVSASFNPEQL